MWIGRANWRQPAGGSGHAVGEQMLLPDGISLLGEGRRFPVCVSQFEQRSAARAAMGMDNMENMKDGEYGEHETGRVRISYAAGEAGVGAGGEEMRIDLSKPRPPACRASDERLHDEWAGKKAKSPKAG